MVVDGSWAAVSTDRADADALLGTGRVRGRRGPAAPAGRRRSPAWPRRPRWPAPATGTTRPRTPPRTSGPRSCASSSTAAGGLETAGYVESTRTESVVRQHRRAVGRRPGHRRRGGRHRPGAGRGRRGPAGLRPARRPRRRRARPDRRGQGQGRRRTRSTCRRATTRSCWSRPAWPTSCASCSCTGSTAGRWARGGRSCGSGEQQFDAGPADLGRAAGRAVDRAAVRRRGHAAAAARPGRGRGQHARSRTTGGPRPRPAASSTGHAVEGGERWGPVPDQPRVGAGAGGSSAELAARMRRGLLVSDFWYTRILDPRTVVVTGLTRNGVWLVENGEIVAPVSTLRFTQSYPDALAPGRDPRRRLGRQPGPGPRAGRAGPHARACTWPAGTSPAAPPASGQGCGDRAVGPAVMTGRRGQSCDDRAVGGEPGRRRPARPRRASAARRARARWARRSMTTAVQARRSRSGRSARPGRSARRPRPSTPSSSRSSRTSAAALGLARLDLAARQLPARPAVPPRRQHPAARVPQHRAHHHPHPATLPPPPCWHATVRARGSGRAWWDGAS